MKKVLETGAKCSVLVCYLHTAKTVKETLLNMCHNERLHILVAIQEENHIINRINQPCIIFCHEQFDGIEYSVCETVHSSGGKMSSRPYIC